MADQSGRVRRHVAVAEKGHRRSLHLAKIKAEPGHDVYKISDEQLAEWKKSAEPLQQKWAASVKKAGGDPVTIWKELQASLTQYSAGF